MQVYVEYSEMSFRGHNGHMTKSALPKPIIVHLPYRSIDDKTEIEKALSTSAGETSLSAVERSTLHYIYDYPTVYVVHSQQENEHTSHSEYTVYVGETNNIHSRTMQHLKADSKLRDDWKEFRKRLQDNPYSVWQYIIGNAHFNKSLTLDVENRLMHYLLGSESVKTLNNRRTNAQGDYYTQDEFDQIFSDIWLELNRQDSKLFPAEEIIRDSALFKASPFHQLSEDQLVAEEAIMDVLSAVLSDTDGTDVSRLIFVQGAAGTGKTVLLSHLFYRIVAEMNVGGYLDDEEDEDLLEHDSARMLGKDERRKAYILVNHEQQVHVYNQIATKLGLQKHSGDVAIKPAQFINRFSEKTASNRAIPDRPRGKADVVLVDEAHLLLTQGNQGYSGKNMLHDLLRRAKVVIAVFDPNQILQTSQRWDTEELRKLFPQRKRVDVRNGQLERFTPLDMWGDRYLLSHICLNKQFRIAADDATIRWIDDFADGTAIGPIPEDRGEKDAQTDKYIRTPFEIKIFDSPIELFKAIKEKAYLKAAGVDGCGLSRVVATYDWEYKGNKTNDSSPDGLWNVEMHRDGQGVWHMGAAPDVRRGYDASDPDGNPDYFCHPWNYEIKADEKVLSPDEVWAENPHTLNEVGSTFSIQGFDLNYVGVIIGPSVTYRNGKIIFDEKESRNVRAVSKRNGSVSYAQSNLRNELNVLLKRGVHGLYLFAVDPELQLALKRAGQRTDSNAPMTVKKQSSAD